LQENTSPDFAGPTEIITTCSRNLSSTLLETPKNSPALKSKPNFTYAENWSVGRLVFALALA